MRFGDVSIHIEVPGDFRQGELNPLELSREDDLATQPGILLKHGRHVQHVILPGKQNTSVHFAQSRMGEGDVSWALLPFIGFRQFAQMSSTHVDVTR